MTEQSRVEAVADALIGADMTLTVDDAVMLAQAAIEANDAWLAGQGDSAHKVNPDLFSMIEMIRKRMNPAPASHELVAAILSDWAEFHK